MRYFLTSGLIYALLCLSSPATASPEDEPNRLLDGFHQAASRTDFSDYFSWSAQESVFLGTDGSGRWTLKEFKAYTKPHFASGTGWTYKPLERFWPISGNVAQYDLALPIPNGIVDDVANQVKHAMTTDED
ncbi:MAG: hypothetical protein ACJAYE_000745 [Candidatus Azotimanducaceae bacterium]|jgi:hypothetical protein